jgi:hypothetical protein
VTTDALVTTADPIIGTIGSAFYFIPPTLEKGKALGLDGFRWYFIGRGGVLGDVEAPVVASAFGYFNPGLVDKMWSGARDKIAPRDAGRSYLACAHDLGRAKFGSVEGLGAFCEAAEAVLANAEPAALSLFAGLNAEPRADDLPARAMQLVATLRELRGSVHLVAVVASGVSVRAAHQIRRPDMVKGFGWDGEIAVTDADQAKLAAADRLTDELMSRIWSVLDDSAAAHVVTTVTALQAALA